TATPATGWTLARQSAISRRIGICLMECSETRGSSVCRREVALCCAQTTCHCWRQASPLSPLWCWGLMSDSLQMCTWGLTPYLTQGAGWPLEPWSATASCGRACRWERVLRCVVVPWPQESRYRPQVPWCRRYERVKHPGYASRLAHSGASGYYVS